MVNIFLNDSYKLLKLLYDNQTVILDKTVVPLTQVEISKALDMSKAKVNVLFKILQDEGLLAKLNSSHIPKNVLYDVFEE